MHALIVLAHPEERSLNAGLARTAEATFKSAGYTVDVADLYRERFDPLEDARHYRLRADEDIFDAMAEQRHASDSDTLPEDVERSIARLERADVVMFQYPLWWWSVPAVLKGWLDRVLVWGRIYSSRVRYWDRGHFRGKRAFVSVTTGAQEEAFGPDGRAGNIDLVLWPMHFSLSYVGFSVLPPVRTFGVSGRKPERDQSSSHTDHLSNYIARLDSLEPLKFNSSRDWDERGRLRHDAPSYGPFIRHLAPCTSDGPGQFDDRYKGQAAPLGAPGRRP